MKAPKKFGRFTPLSASGHRRPLWRRRLSILAPLRAGRWQLLAYDLGVAVFLGLQMHLVWHVDADDTRELAENKVTSNTPVLVLAILFSGRQPGRCRRAARRLQKLESPSGEGPYGSLA